MSQDLRWREVGLPALNAALSSGRTYFLPGELRPEWTQQLPTVTAAWLYYEGGPLLGSTGSLSTSAAQARMDVERFDPSDPNLLKYDRYYFVRMVDDRVFQLGPFKDQDYGHHLRQRPQWTQQYSSRSTGL